MAKAQIAAVIPAYKARATIVEVIKGLDKRVDLIFVVDDGCPEGSGKWVQEQVSQKNVQVIFHEKNSGVGAAVISGYRAALAAGAEVVVKIDSDGQMDSSKIQSLVVPIVQGNADYTKGDRLDSLVGLKHMPSIRLLGNAGLTLLTKISTGYWNVKDPTNGFTAIHSDLIRRLPLGMINRGYFFESDMLFRLAILRAVVMDVPMPAVYGSEKSSLSIWKALFQFPYFHSINYFKRIFYNYFLRDINAASVELVAGTVLWWFGVIFGVLAYLESSASGVPATTGSVMIAVLPIILGFQLLLAFVSFDVTSVPRVVRHAKRNS